MSEDSAALSKGHVVRNEVSSPQSMISISEADRPAPGKGSSPRLKLVMPEFYSPHIPVLKSEPLAPQNGTVFGDKAFKEMTKLKQSC